MVRLLSMFKKRVLPLRGCVLGLCGALMVLWSWSGGALAELKTYVIGDEAHPWREAGTLEGIDDVAEPGWMQPVKTSRAQNILSQLYDQGDLFAGYHREGRVVDPAYTEGKARIWSPNVGFRERTDLLRLADGRLDTLAFDYFNRTASNLGVTIYVDLGFPYPVDEIRFYPLHKTPEGDRKYSGFDWGTHEDLYLKGFELYANDGSEVTLDATGKPMYHLLDAVPTNTNVVVVDTTFEPQHIRYLKIRSTSAEAFEIDQLDIRGEGYLGNVRFVSDVIDLGDLSNIGRIGWKAEQDPGTAIRIQTKVGNDRTTLRYFQLNDIGEEEELTGETDEENSRAWAKLPSELRGRGGVADEENWSRWSPSYTSPGEALAALGPHQYLQIRIVMTNESPLYRAKMDNISFEYSQPTVARRLLGRISPNVDVDLGRETRFTYTVQPAMTDRNTGFDILQIATPVEATVLSVKVGERTIPEEGYESKTEEKQLTLRLLNVEDRIASEGDVLEVTFTCSILSYGTVFQGEALASWEPGDLPQMVEEERVGDLAVRGAPGSLGKIISDVDVAPNPFTPNGDGSNDVTFIRFKVFQVIGSAPISLAIYDPSGAAVRTGFADLPREVESKEFHVPWDGRGDDGELVPPGVYLFRVSIHGDEGDFSTAGSIVLVY